MKVIGKYLIRILFFLSLISGLLFLHFENLKSFFLTNQTLNSVILIVIGSGIIFIVKQLINIKNEFPNTLKDQYKTGFQYYDLQIDDKKLVELNVKDAEKKGATIIENREVIRANRNKNVWDIILDDNTLLKTKILINAAGPLDK